MAVESNITYEGELHCTAVHGPSRKSISTDAPTDNGGKGEAFSPTDLVGASMGTCMLTIMGLLARRHDWDLRGTTCNVVKEMVNQPHRRIAALHVKFTFPPTREWSDADRKRLEAAAETCPVKRSLHPEVEVNIEYVYQ